MQNGVSFCTVVVCTHLNQHKSEFFGLSEELRKSTCCLLWQSYTPAQERKQQTCLRHGEIFYQCAFTQRTQEEIGNSSNMIREKKIQLWKNNQIEGASNIKRNKKKNASVEVHQSSGFKMPWCQWSVRVKHALASVVTRSNKCPGVTGSNICPSMSRCYGV